jgi:hypothetical protein
MNNDIYGTMNGNKGFSAGARLDEQNHNLRRSGAARQAMGDVWEFYWDNDAIGRTGSNTKSKSGLEIGWTGCKDDKRHRLGHYVADSDLR